jgi:tetratricopeptide (TPR) repeat protein
MYLDRDYKPRRRKSRWRFWPLILMAVLAIHFYNRPPEWINTTPLQPTPTPTRSAISWLAEAQRYEQSGDWTRAIATYQVAESLEPDNPDPLVAQSRLLVLLDDIPQAVQLARRAVDLAPEDADALNALARALDWQGEYDDAVDFALEAYLIEPSNADTLAILGEIYADVGNWVRSQEYLDQALEADPDNVLAHRNQAWLYERQGDYDLAIAAYNAAIERAPNRADLYIGKGLQYQALFMWDEAIEAYTQATEVNPNVAFTWDALGWGLYLSGDPLQALRVLRQAVEVDPADGNAQAHLGLVYYARRNYEDAVPALETGISILGDASRIEYYYQLGLAHIYKEPQECDKAIPWLNKALEIDPGSLPALEGLRVCG